MNPSAIPERSTEVHVWTTCRRALASAADAILRALERGPAPIADLLYGWPLTRMHLHLFVERLIEQGVVSHTEESADRGEIRRATAGMALITGVVCDAPDVRRERAERGAADRPALAGRGWPGPGAGRREGCAGAVLRRNNGEREA
jgi:hypothetical protein